MWGQIYLVLGLIFIFAYLLERRVSLGPAMIWAQVLSSISLVRKDLRCMPNLPWVHAVSITLGEGPLAALNLPWPWWGPLSANGERKGKYSFQFYSANPGEEEKFVTEGPSQKRGTKDGLFWGYSIFFYDL